MSGSKPMGKKELAVLRQLATEEVEKNTDAVDFAFWSGLLEKCCVALFHVDPETQKEAKLDICNCLNRGIKIASAVTDTIPGAWPLPKVFFTVWGDDE